MKLYKFEKMWEILIMLKLVVGKCIIKYASNNTYRRYINILVKDIVFGKFWVAVLMSDNIISEIVIKNYFLSVVVAPTFEVS